MEAEILLLADDDKPGVWVIRSDCGDVPENVAEPLQECINQVVTKHAEYLQILGQVDRSQSSTSKCM